MVIRVITFNVLSPQLATSVAFPNSRPEDLNCHNRFSRLKKMLEGWIVGANTNSSSISYRWQDMLPLICLQELSLEWVSELSVWFLERGYNFFATNYGNFYCGYMGVGLAVPTNFKVLKLKYGLPIEGLEDSVALEELEIQEQIWKLIKTKYNRYVALKLKSSEDFVFWLVTFHMPCCWKFPELMEGLTKIFRFKMDQLIGKDELIIAGDFNFTPDSPSYGRMLRAIGDKEECQNLKVVPPVFYSCRSGSSPSFEGAVDHIFYRGSSWKSVELEHPYYYEGFLPNEHHPSDHLYVAAKFTTSRVRASAPKVFVRKAQCKGTCGIECQRCYPSPKDSRRS